MLTSKALTVNMTISQWTARKHDKKISDEVEAIHNAKDAGRYNKLLVAKEELSKIQKAANAARTFHYENTLPWGDNGDRLLPSANYFSYVQEIQKLKNEYDHSVHEFLNNYDAVVEDAKLRLNGMFNQSDYPNRFEIERKFSFNTVFLPLPETDFRLDISQKEIDVLKMAMETEINNRLTNAVRDTWQRIKDQLQHMKTKLSDNEAIFRDSLFNNLKDIIDLLPKLNVTNSPEISAICEDMKVLLIDSPEAIRTNPALRQNKANEVDELMSKYNGFF